MLVLPHMQVQHQRGVASRSCRQHHAAVAAGGERHPVPRVRQLVLRHRVAQLDQRAAQSAAVDGMRAGGVVGVGEGAMPQRAVGGNGDAPRGVGGGHIVAPPAVAEAEGSREGDAIHIAAAHDIMLLDALGVVVGIAPAVVEGPVGGRDAEPHTLSVIGTKVEAHSREVAAAVRVVALVEGVPPFGGHAVEGHAVAVGGGQRPKGVVEQFDAETRRVRAVGMLHRRAAADIHPDAVVHGHSIFHHQQVAHGGIYADGVEHRCRLPVAEAVAEPHHGSVARRYDAREDHLAGTHFGVGVGGDGVRAAIDARHTRPVGAAGAKLQVWLHRGAYVGQRHRRVAVGDGHARPFAVRRNIKIAI